jgi:hypothetical protein
MKLGGGARSTSAISKIARRPFEIEIPSSRLGIDPALIEFGAGSGSIGEGDSVEITRQWPEGPAFCRLNTFQLENQEIITFDKAKISNSGSEIIYQLRVVTANAESEIDLNVPL